MARRYTKLHRIRQKKAIWKKILKNRFFWLGIGILLFFSGFAYAVLFSPLFEVRQIEVAGNQKIPTQELEKFVNQRIERKILFFRINHLLLVDSRKIQEDMGDTFPALEKVLIKKKWFHSLALNVQERSGVAVWCRKKSYQVEFSDTTKNETRAVAQCLTLDKNGIIFEKTESGEQVVISSPETNKEVRQGSKVIDEELLQTLLRFQKELDAFALFGELKLRVSSLSVISQDRVNVKISEGWEVYLNPQDNMDWQITKLKLVLEREIPAEKRPKLDYIDLRFGDQAYVKYRD